MTDFFNVREIADKITGDYQEDQKSEDLSGENQNKFAPYIFTAPKTFQYPIDVGESEEQPHSVRFYINARDNSRVAERTNDGIRTSGVLKNAGGSLEPVDTTAQNNLQVTIDAITAGNTDSLPTTVFPNLATLGVSGTLQTEKAAIDKYNGEIITREYGFAKGKPFYSFDIYNQNKNMQTEITIDAENGAIISVEEELYQIGPDRTF